MIRLKEIRKAQGRTQQEIADELGMHLTNYNKLENGKTDLSVSTMEKLADILHCQPADFISLRSNIRTVQVTQHVAAGIWEESHIWHNSEWYEVAVPDDEKYRNINLYGAETSGPSMNKRYPEGSALVYSSIIETGESPVPGRRYIVETERADGLREATVKTLYRDEAGKLWLLPESYDPRYQQAIDLSADAGDMIRIVGRVLFAVQRED